MVLTDYHIPCNVYIGTSCRNVSYQHDSVQDVVEPREHILIDFYGLMTHFVHVQHTDGVVVPSEFSLTP